MSDNYFLIYFNTFLFSLITNVVEIDLRRFVTVNLRDVLIFSTAFEIIILFFFIKYLSFLLKLRQNFNINGIIY